MPRGGRAARYRRMIVTIVSSTTSAFPRLLKGPGTQADMILSHLRSLDNVLLYRFFGHPLPKATPSGFRRPSGAYEPLRNGSGGLRPRLLTVAPSGLKTHGRKCHAPTSPAGSRCHTSPHGSRYHASPTGSRCHAPPGGWRSMMDSTRIRLSSGKWRQYWHATARFACQRRFGAREWLM